MLFLSSNYGGAKRRTTQVSMPTAHRLAGGPCGRTSHGRKLYQKTEAMLRLHFYLDRAARLIALQSQPENRHRDKKKKDRPDEELS